ncbi:hypothetical protein ACEQ8H_001107 [Pleosporales sp. CAS-2024a]
MSDMEAAKAKARGGGSVSWTEHEVLVYLLSAIEHNNIKIDFAKTPAPFGRNASGCSQKISKIRTALRAEIDAIKNASPFPLPPATATASTTTTPKKKLPPTRKRKPATEDDDDDDEPTPKKRAGGPKSSIKEETVKEEPDDEMRSPGEYAYEV